MVGDLSDVKSMLESGLIQPPFLYQNFIEIEPRLIRYPALDPDSFRKIVETFCHISSLFSPHRSPQKEPEPTVTTILSSES
jgi:hypothetical protein